MLRPMSLIWLLACAESLPAPEADTAGAARGAAAVEVCNGIDDDGDDRVDEGIDVDKDGISDCDEDPCAVNDPTLWFSTDARELGWYNPTNGVVRKVGTMVGNVRDIGFGPDGRLWGTTAEGRLLEINEATANTKIRGSIPARAADAMAVDGQGVGVSAEGSRLRFADVSPLQPRGVVPLPGAFTILDVSWFQGDLYASGTRLGQRTLLRVGASTVSQQRGPAWDGITSRSDGTFWGITGTRIDRIQPASGASSLLVDLSVMPVVGGRLTGTPNGLTSRTAWCAERDEVCNGRDDDFDGDVDEGFDADGDGITDCMEVEICNGLDEDGLGETDEGFPDTDGDGLADCVDIEVCNGEDDDGDGVADEGFDADEDGLSDCEEHPCEVDASVVWVLTGSWGAACRYERVDLDTETTQAWDFPSDHPLCAITGLAMGSDYGLWGLRGLPTGEQDVVRLDPATGVVTPAVYAGAGDGLATGPGGSLWTVDGASGTLNRVDAAAAPLTFPSAANAPTSLGARDAAWHDGHPIVATPYVTAQYTPTGVLTWLPRSMFGTVAPWGGIATAGGQVYLSAVRNVVFQATTTNPQNLPMRPFAFASADTRPVRDLAGSGDVCGAMVDVCDGADDDHDGQVDEGHPDTDADGVADCVDAETCDGVDNDGDGSIDEDFSGDSDADGTVDCADVETCDGVDNDGDGALDDGFPDTDGDGTADCMDTELCNGDDDDGDGEVDEGHDIDEDGTPDCEEHPCDVDDPTVWMVRPGNQAVVYDRLDVRTGAVVESYTFPGNYPENYHEFNTYTSIAVGPDGALYGAGWRSGAVVVARLDLHSGLATVLPRAGGTGPGLVADHLGDFWFHQQQIQSGRGTWTPVPRSGTLWGLGDLAWWNGALLLATNQGIVSADVSGAPGTTTTSLVAPTFSWGLASADGAVIVAEPTTNSTNIYRIDPDSLAGATLIATLPGHVYDLASFHDICQSIGDTCNSIDDDHDGQTDEGHADTDDDGTADCVDEETCDGLDNDGDGFVDEGAPDTDGDGTADCMDVEVCNGVDDNGNGVIDDSILDADVDGVPDCADVEACDDLDNDGDGVNNEGYDLDDDGIADCFELPCDVTDDTWWFSTVDGVITRFNPANGQRSILGPTWPDLTDVAWAANGLLYGVSATGDLVIIDPVTGAATFDRHVGAGALGLGADANGNLWIGYDDRLKRYNLFDGDTDSWDALGVDVHDITMHGHTPTAIVFDPTAGRSFVSEFDPGAGAFTSASGVDTSVWTGALPASDKEIVISIFGISRFYELQSGAQRVGPTIGAPETGATSRADACPR